MATVIYNHREMEYNCEKWWKEHMSEKPDFSNVLSKEENLFDKIQKVLQWINTYSFEEEYAMDYGLDTLRLYLLFEGEPKEDYREGSLEGIYKFLNRLMTLVNNSVSKSMGIEHNERKPLKKVSESEEEHQINHELEKVCSLCKEEVEQAINKNNLHSIVAAFMEAMTKLSQISKKQEVTIPEKYLEEIAIMLSAFAPYMSEYIWNTLGKTDSVFEQAWPVMELADYKCENNRIDLVIQINGKTKKVVKTEAGKTVQEIEKIAKEILQERYPDNVGNICYVQDKIVNIVTK